MKKISIIIPVYNEESTIDEIIRRVNKTDTLSFRKEIIVVDDCSKDGTKRLLEKYRRTKAIKLIRHQQNQGKGAALKTGFKMSTGSLVIIQDADLEYSPDDYPRMIKPIIGGYADVVYGSRFLNSSPHRVLYFWHFLANKLITTLSNMFTNLNLTDIETGYKVFRGDLIREIAPFLKSNRFGFEPEITSRIAKVKNIRIYEIGVSYFGRTYEEGKKIRWTDAVAAIGAIIRYGIFPG